MVVRPTSQSKCPALWCDLWPFDIARPLLQHGRILCSAWTARRSWRISCLNQTYVARPEVDAQCGPLCCAAMVACQLMCAAPHRVASATLLGTTLTGCEMLIPLNANPVRLAKVRRRCMGGACSGMRPAMKQGAVCIAV